MIGKPTQEELEKREVHNKYFNSTNYPLMMLNEHALQNKYRQREKIMNDESLRVTEFEIKQEHLTLIKDCCVDWYGGISIDHKRPFGNSDIIRDIGEILGEEPEGFDDDDDLFSTEQSERFMRLYRELSVVLQIALNTQSFKVGKYIRDNPYSAIWRPADA